MGEQEDSKELAEGTAAELRGNLMKPISRRKLLASLSLAGAVIAAEGLILSSAFASAKEESVTDATYGKRGGGGGGGLPGLTSRVEALEACCDGQVQLVDFGADGTVTADTAALASLAAYVNGFPNGTAPFFTVDGLPVRVGINRASAPMKYTISTGVQFTRPVELMGSLSKVLDYTGTGAMLTMGPDDGRTSGNLFRDDHYIMEGLHFTGGKQMTVGITFTPFTGFMARIKDCVFNMFGNPNSWAIDFQAQNWWPEITGCRWETYDTQSKNFVKAIDDGRGGAYRGSGNSRLSFVDNKGKWHGEIGNGGIGIYTNAVKTLISRCDFENAGTGIQLGYPSLKTEVENCYFEQYTGSVSIRLGDDTAQPNNSINLISIRGIFCNLHQAGKFLDTGNANVIASGLDVDGVTLSAGQEQSPVLNLNDLPGQYVRVRNIVASYQPLLPVTTNPIKVIDVDGVLNKSVINGALAASQFGDNYTVPAIALKQLTDMWFAVTDFPSCTASRVKLDHTDYLRTRFSPYALKFNQGGTGTYKAVFFMVPNLCDMVGHVNTLQVFARSSSAANLRIVPKAAYNAATIVSVANKNETVLLTSEFQEFTIPFFVPDHENLNQDSWFILELNMPDSADWYEFTGVRINQADFGLCHSNNTMTEGETLAAVRQYFERRSVVLSGNSFSKMTLDMASKARALTSAVMTFTSPAISPINGVEVQGGAVFNLGTAHTDVEAVVDFDTRAFYF
ncbi:hypothetical protein [Paenibacillus eucommiae]|uniref:Right-handed parallel beta-helix repeat-containing protein n=1 Tax=Paenibacillus eucommiae TaxID=1355755 RepID=A0ABS4JCA6_9BACL|nr:hypothetical protein [Paenibacillus eucommiae]MBP1996835.1 hypothetical protein [Paenibacillus eucommiae]